MYSALADLSGGRKKVLTARERGGEAGSGRVCPELRPGQERLYGPAIFRSHLPDFGYAPHIDSVRHRERRVDYEVFRFAAQLGGILLLQDPVREPLVGEGKTPGYTPPSKEYHDTIMYNAPVSDPRVAEVLAMATNGVAAGQLDTSIFRQWAKREHIESYEVDLQVGDMYFFKSVRCCSHSVLRTCGVLSTADPRTLSMRCPASLGI
eukprot:SAG31_NODE_3902_length_3768_cov_5.032979_2_plen_207_part_00